MSVLLASAAAAADFRRHFIVERFGFPTRWRAPGHLGNWWFSPSACFSNRAETDTPFCHFR